MVEMENELQINKMVGNEQLVKKGLVVERVTKKRSRSGTVRTLNWTALLDWTATAS